MLRLLVVADDPRTEHDMARRAAAALDLLPGVPDAEVVVSQRARGRSAVERLDAGLFTRPLPDRLLVVGRRASCSPTELAFLHHMLDLRPELCAVTAAESAGRGVDALLGLGAIFQGGPACQAGGFAGDARGSIVERIERLGFAHALVPAAPPLHLDLPERVPA